MLKRTALTAVLALGTLVAVAGPVAAKDGDLIARGHCTGASTWKLKVSPEGRRLEVEFQVDQNRNDRLWRVKIAQDGHLVWRGSRYTRAPSGSFTVRRLLVNTAGSDRIAARATNVKTGEVCRGVLTARF